LGWDLHQKPKEETKNDMSKAKLVPMAAYSDTDFMRIAERYHTISAQAQASGTQPPPEWNFLARAVEYIVVLRQNQDKKEPGPLRRAVRT
jgi:hypothetical protein